MIIKFLDLQAFGPFTGKFIDFGNDPALHIIYGPNEAGKSSALRGLKAFLYGFPERTTDNFVHPNDKLLVGGCLRLSDGRELIFNRRKKRLADMLDAQGDILSADALGPYLGGIAPEVFAALYGITHDELVQGGREILAQRGEIGQALFAAGSGLSSLKEVMDNLQVEADELFKRKGSKPQINQLLAEYNRLRKESREAVLPGRQWHEHHRALTDAEQELAALEKDKLAIEGQRRKLERLQRALPQLARRQILNDELQQLGRVTVLPVDFGDRRQSIDKEIHAARRQQEIAGGHLAELTKAGGLIPSPSDILAQAVEIEELYQGLDRYRKDRRDQDKLEGLRVAYRTETAELLQQIRPDIPLADIETLRPFLNRRRAIQQLAGKHEALKQGHKMADSRLASLQRELAAAKAALADIPPPENLDALRLACRLAQRAGNIDEELAKRERAVKALWEKCQDDLTSLGLWHGKLTDIGRLHLPLTETIKRFERLFADLQERERLQRLAFEQTAKELIDRETELKTLQIGGQVPTEEELQAARQSRDQDWQELRHLILQRHTAPDLDSMAAGYEGKVAAADTIADRLRREADRVHKYAILQGDTKKLRQRREELSREAAELAAERQTLEADWQEQWAAAAIPPLSPNEMLAWVNDFDRIRFQITEAEKLRAELEGTEEQRQKLLKALLTELDRFNYQGTRTELQPPLLFAETTLQRHDKLALERQRLTSRISGRQAEIEQAGTECRQMAQQLDKWQREWLAVLGDWQQDNPPPPSEVNDILETLRSCFDKLRESDTLKKRIKGIERDLDNFERAVARLTPEAHNHLPSEQVVRLLMADLTAAGKNKALLDKCNKELAAAREESRLADARLRRLDEQRAELLKIANCQAADLPEAERRSSNFLQLKEKLEAVETALLEIAQGLKISELEQEAESVKSADDLPGQISAASHRLEQEIAPRIKQLSEIKGRESNTLAGMDGTSRAAEIEEKMQGILARIQRLAGQFIRLKTAAGILRQQIENYRAANQNPVLAIASLHFAALTRQSFTGLLTDEDNKGRPVLVGTKGDNDRVRVDNMSSGTRDQLYLSLRLASLQRRLHNSEPMPFIVDDILVNFDDQRASATLDVLLELAKTTQIIIFTHHHQIVTYADQLDNAGLIQIHNL